MNALINISKWMTTLSDGDFSSDLKSVNTVNNFRDDVQHKINCIRLLSGDRWAVFHHDSYEFVVILSALWQLGKTACVPGDNCIGTIERLQSRVSGFLGEFDNHAQAMENGALEVDHAFQWKDLESDFEALEIYTSGSTGEPKPITKTIRQLQNEVIALSEQWPDARSSAVLATVSHQHMYGMVFKLFWPISTGRLFVTKTCDYIEDILYQASFFPSFCLVSSPSHLGRLNRLSQWELLQSTCEYVVSSAAPLNKIDSIRVSQLLNTRVREIYGSSETGAIAWRIQNTSEGEGLWQPLPKVDFGLSESGVLICRAPYLDVTGFYELPDNAKFTDDGFQLLGRSDSIVKIEGKRVSLISLENRLKEHSLVNNCKVISIERKRVETAAVVELTDAAFQELSLLGRKPLIESLRNSLKGHFETVVLPRRWRFVKRLPYNSQGKLPLLELQKMFEPKKIEWPIINEKILDESNVVLKCQIPQELMYFDGHFDKTPILAGIVQVHWAQAYGRQYLSVEGKFTKLEKIKFKLVITPSSNIDIVLSYDRIKNKLQFVYQSEKGIHSSGYICLRS